MKNSAVKIAVMSLMAFLVGSFVMTGCGSDENNPASSPPPSGTQHTIVISDFNFSPASVTIAAGDRVVWRNDDNVGHTVTSDSGSELDSPLFGQGGTYGHTFSTAGSYPYHCKPHPNMTAVVNVE